MEPSRASVCDSSSLRASFADRFHDIPDALRDVMIRACVKIMDRAVRLVAIVMRRMSLDDQCSVRIEQMASEIDAAQMMGFQVGEMAERLARLRTISSKYEQAVERMAHRQGAIRQLREKLQALEAEEKNDCNVLCDCRSQFRNVVEAPWKEIVD